MSRYERLCYGLRCLLRLGILDLQMLFALHCSAIGAGLIDVAFEVREDWKGYPEMSIKLYL